MTLHKIGDTIKETTDINPNKGIIIFVDKSDMVRMSYLCIVKDNFNKSLKIRYETEEGDKKIYGELLNIYPPDTLISWLSIKSELIKELEDIE